MRSQTLRKATLGASGKWRGLDPAVARRGRADLAAGPPVIFRHALRLIERKPALRLHGSLEAAKIFLLMLPVDLLRETLIVFGVFPTPPFDVPIGKGQVRTLVVPVGREVPPSLLTQ